MTIEQCLQQGDALGLWEQVRGWGYRIVRRYRGLAARNGAVDVDDLMQCAFLGMLEAMRAYDADRGSFLTVMRFYVTRECRKALGLTGRVRTEHYESVATETPTVGGLTLMDTLEDDTLPGVADRLELEDLRREVRAAVDKLPQCKREIITRHDLEGEPMAAAARACGLPYAAARQQRGQGLIALSRTLRRYKPPTYYRYKGVAAFHSSMSSVVEDIVLWMNRQ